MATTDFEAAYAAAGSETPEELRRQARREELLGRVYTIDDLLAQESKAAEPLVGPFVRRQGKTIIGAHGGHGKSTMAFRIGHALVNESEFIGHQGVGGTVLVIDVEQNMTSAQRQAMQAFYPGKWDRGQPVHEVMLSMPRIDSAGKMFYAHWPEGVELGKPGIDLDVVGELIDKCDADLVIPDPVYKLMMGNPNEAETVMGFIQNWDRLREQLGFATLLPMHPRKPPVQGGGSLTMHDLYGHAHWSWWAEQIFMLKRVPGSFGATLRIEKDRESELIHGDEWHLTFDEREGFIRNSSDMGEDGRTLPAWIQVWDLFQKDDNTGRLFTREEIARMLGMPPDTVIKATKELERRVPAGLVVEKGAKGIKLYGYQPLPAPTLDQRIDEVEAKLRTLDAVEEDE